MDSSEKILHLIRLASNSLSSTGPLYQNVEGLNKEVMLKAVGKALSSIFEIDDAICKLRPALTADQWKLINQDKDAFDAFDAEFEKLNAAMEAEATGNLGTAQALFSDIESSSQVEDNRVRAQAGLYRIKTKR
ncbi:hypothetical protein [Enterovibrio norvegicus]|uniref:Uncharacterized protein n=1 Tax=Enterovibrio norvegicus TaxID=188144 RepID=A0A2N7L3B6_9GAMM|nr:hypothetical protein [Enterovibrio norvegicus]PMN87392.1 hypothetical protein BCT23_08530 [Enterovibrio norvegicus]